MDRFRHILHVKEGHGLLNSWIWEFDHVHISSDCNKYVSNHSSESYPVRVDPNSGKQKSIQRSSVFERFEIYLLCGHRFTDLSILRGVWRRGEELAGVLDSKRDFVKLFVDDGCVLQGQRVSGF